MSVCQRKGDTVSEERVCQCVRGISMPLCQWKGRVTVSGKKGISLCQRKQHATLSGEMAERAYYCVGRKELVNVMSVSE